MAIIGIVVLVITFLGILWAVVRRLRGLFSRHVTHSDIRIRRGEKTSNFGLLNVRLAYSGSTPLIIEQVRFRTRLTVPGRGNQIRLWILLAIAYLTNDLEGMTAVEGPLRSKGHPSLRRALFLVSGIITMVLAILFVVDPILLIGLLLLGPPEELKVLLVADDEQIDIRCLDEDIDCRRPFLVKPGSVNNYLMRCEIQAKKEMFNESQFFRQRISVAYADAASKQPRWQLPRPGKMLWKADERLEVRIAGRLFSYPVGSDRQPALVRILPPKPDPAQASSSNKSRTVHRRGRRRAGSDSR